MDLPFPPIEFRRLVGPTETKFFDNTSRALVFPDVKPDAYASVFDFGCGCGRLARQLIQQQPQPARYLGVDRHTGMVAWCRENLAPHAPHFDFRHHDVLHDVLNPTGTPGHLPLPVSDGEVTLFIAWSVFTHLLEADAEFYLHELARVLHPRGMAVCTWFTFDKSDYPMMQEFQNALYINPGDPTNAVIFDRAWMLDRLEQAGLVATRIVPPKIKGFQWMLYLERTGSGGTAAKFPEDCAPQGLARPPLG